MNTPKPKRRTVRCPHCSSTKTASIWYGGIGPDPELDSVMYKRLQAGRAIVLPIDFDEAGEPVFSSAIRFCHACKTRY